MNDLTENSEYIELIERIEQIINEAKYNIAKSVNTNMVQAYWNIGKYIVEFEQGGSFKAKYGEALLTNLSKDLRLRFGRGYSRPNLNNMRKFYKYYPICQNISDKLSWSHFCELIKLDDEYREVLDIRALDTDYDKKLEEAKQFDYFPVSLSEFEGQKENIASLKQAVIQSENPYLITEAANYIEYLNRYKGMNYSLEDLTAKQVELSDPMSLYEYLSSVPSVKDKMPLIKGISASGKKKFLKYTYEYVPGLADSDKEYLENAIAEGR